MYRYSNINFDYILKIFFFNYVYYYQSYLYSNNTYYSFIFTVKFSNVYFNLEYIYFLLKITEFNCKIYKDNIYILYL